MPELELSVPQAKAAKRASASAPPEAPRRRLPPLSPATIERIRQRPIELACNYPDHREALLDYGTPRAAKPWARASMQCGVCRPDPARWWADRESAIRALARWVNGGLA